MIRGRWRRRVSLAPLLAILLAVFGAGPASAHVIGTSAKPSNYRTRVLNISPPVPGVTVRVVEAGGKLELTNHSSQPVLVLGYDNEPYLRVGPSGVQENERSPSTWSNRSAVPPKTRPPAGLDPSAPPQWRRISTAPVAIWHDHRSHWAGPGDPAAVRAARGRTQVVVPDWRVPLRVGSQTVIVSGEIEWVPGPAPWLWIAVAVLLCAAVLLLARLDASLRLWALIPATVLAVAADIIHASGSWLGSTASTITKLYSNATPLAGWIVAGLAIWRLLRDRDRAASRSPCPIRPRPRGRQHLPADRRHLPGSRRCPPRHRRTGQLTDPRTVPTPPHSLGGRHHPRSRRLPGPRRPTGAPARTLRPLSAGAGRHRRPHRCGILNTVECRPRGCEGAWT